MKLTKYSTPDEVITYHPKREEWDEKMSDPWYKPVNPTMNGHLGAQDRVCMRRHIREHFPTFAEYANLNEMGDRELRSTINKLSTEAMGF